MEIWIWKKNNENESERAASTSRGDERAAISAPRLRSRGGDRRDGRDVTGAGNDCPPHSYGYILSLEESVRRRVG